MTAAEQKKVLDERVTLYDTDIRLLNSRIENLKAKDSVSAEIMESYRREIWTMVSQKALYNAELNNISRLLKKEKRKRFWTIVGGIATTTGALWLGSKF